MARRRIAGLVIIFGLTFLNIWMAKFIIRPMREVRRFQTTHGPRGRKMSDILVISVDDIHPIQHLEESATLYKTSTATLKVDLHGPPPNATVRPRVIASSNISRHPDSSTGHKTSLNSGSFRYNSEGSHSHADNIHKQDMDRVAKDKKKGNQEVVNMAVKNSQISTNLNNYYRTFVGPKTNYPPFEPIQKLNSKGNNLSNFHVAESDINNSDYQNTEDLANIKESLRALKELLVKFKTPQRRYESTSLSPPIKTHLNAPQYKIKDKTAIFGDKLDQNILVKASDPHTRASILDSNKDGPVPPLHAAPKSLTAPSTDLLHKLSAVPGRESWNVVANENPGDVQELLSAMLRQPQQQQSHQMLQNSLQANKQQQQLLQLKPDEQQQQQQQQQLSNVKHSPGGYRLPNKATNSQDAWSAESNKLLQEMLKNLSSDNNPKDRPDDIKFLNDLLQSINTRSPPMAPVFDAAGLYPNGARFVDTAGNHGNRNYLDLR